MKIRNTRVSARPSLQESVKQILLNMFLVIFLKHLNFSITFLLKGKHLLYPGGLLPVLF